MDCFTETDADFAVLTETWLRDGGFDEFEEELSLGSGLGLLTRNRPPCPNGVSYGGVAIVWKESLGRFREVKIKNPGFELLAAAGSIKGHKRKIVIIGCYLPPGYNRHRGAAALECLRTQL